MLRAGPAEILRYLLRYITPIYWYVYHTNGYCVQAEPRYPRGADGGRRQN